MLFRSVECNKLFDEIDIAIMAAAPADFSAKNFAEQKIKKSPNSDTLNIEFEKTKDIAASLGQRKTNKQTLVIFAAETENVVKNAKDKLVLKNADMIISNDVSKTDSGFNSDQNTVTVITKNYEKPFEIMDKDILSHVLLDEIVPLHNRDV